MLCNQRCSEKELCQHNDKRELPLHGMAAGELHPRPLKYRVALRRGPHAAFS